MSARDDYPLLALPDVALAPIKLDGQNAAALREIDDLRADHTEAILLFGAATTELSALKARRCDGCAHYAPDCPPETFDSPELAFGSCSMPHGDNPEPPMSLCSAIGFVDVLVAASHSCAAWTEKP